jgi:hypothetical protein
VGGRAGAWARAWAGGRVGGWGKLWVGCRVAWWVIGWPAILLPHPSALCVSITTAPAHPLPPCPACLPHTPAGAVVQKGASLRGICFQVPSSHAGEGYCRRLCGRHYGRHRSKRSCYILYAAGHMTCTLPHLARKLPWGCLSSRLPAQCCRSHLCLQPQHPNWAAACPAPPPTALLSPLIEAADAVGKLVQYRHQVPPAYLPALS